MKAQQTHREKGLTIAFLIHSRAFSQIPHVSFIVLQKSKMVWANVREWH